MTLWDRNMRNSRHPTGQGLVIKIALTLMTVAAQLISCEVKLFEPTALVIEVQTGKILAASGSCMASDISCGKQVHLERWALLMTTSRLPKSADVWSALWDCSGKHGGTVPASPKFCTFALVLLELCSFGCWVLPPSCFSRFGKVSLNSALVFLCVCCYSELAGIEGFSQRTI